uniref:Endonuclease-reverse transcriptase n=1 Tax=Cacopsylla melanoneura TaxID=428564 RepID=A0A8D8Z0Z0_9HEMI
MRILRWMCGVTRMDRIRNTRIRGTVKVTEISKKVQERRLQWFGHVERRNQEYVGKRVRDIEVRGKRNRGRPKMRYMDRVKQDLKEKNLDGTLAQNRDSWKRLTKNDDP